MKIWKRSAALLCAVLVAAPLAAQEAAPVDSLALQRMQPRIGLYGLGAWNVHSGAFTGVPEAETCLEFDQGTLSGGTGFGGAAGLLFELPLTDRWSLMLRGGMSLLGADDRVEVNIGPALDPQQDAKVDVISAYTFASTLNAIDLDLSAGYRPFEMPLTFRLGPEVGFLVTADASQDERIASPAGAAYTTGPNGERTRIRNPWSGALNNTGLRVAILAGAEYELPMNAKQTLLLVPEISWSQGLTKVRSDMDWKAHQLRAGASIRYSFPLPSPPPVVVIPPPPVEPRLASTLDLASVSSDSVEHQNVPIRVEEFVNTQTRAFLNYIFFEDSSSTIPARYEALHDGRREFSTAALHNRSTLEVYHQSLNVLGSRMLEHPEATITLTGTNSDRGRETGALALARARAEAVKSYLVDTWGIDAERIIVIARNLPETPSAPDDPDGIQENRRVEIAASTLALLEPITTEDTLRTVDPPIVRLRGTALADAGVRSWKVQISQGDKVLHETGGPGDPPPSLDWNMMLTPDRIPLTEERLTSTLTVEDARGVTTRATDDAQVEQVTIRRKREERLGDVIYERYNLITFEFDKATLSPLNKRIADIIRGHITPRSEVEIIGYTDRLGLEDHNMELSKRRAENTAAALGVPAANARGAGENTVMFDNNLPEGRFLSRTVDVTVKTKVGG